MNFLKIKTKFILLSATLLYIVIVSLFVIYEFKERSSYIKYVMNQKIESIEATINSEISDAKHILYGLATTISEGNLINNPQKLKELVENFDPRFNLDGETSIPFAGIIVINKEQKETSNTILPDFHKHIQEQQNFSTRACIQEQRKEFFKINVSPIRIGTYVKEEIIPINIKIADYKYNYIGAICSGLIVRELNEKLKFRFFYSKHIDGIKISNFNKAFFDKKLKLDNLTTKNLFKSFLLKNDYIFIHKLENFPFCIQVKLKQTSFSAYIYRFLNYSLVIFMFFATILLLFSKRYNNKYIAPLEPVQKKLHSLHQALNTENKVLLELESNCLSTEEFFSANHFAKDVNDLIDGYYTMFLERLSPKTNNNEIQKKILNLIFLEQHFLSSQKTKVSEEKLYLNKLLSIVDEEYTTMQLADFLEKISCYCSEFYHEIKIKVIIDKKDIKSFKFRKAALIETIFNIFTFITRSSFDTDKINFITKGKFIDNNDFPTITIEAEIKDNSDAMIAWELGPDYPHTSLLTIFLLAKENNLFFNIIKKDNKILFVLDPIAKKIEFYNLAMDS